MAEHVAGTEVRTPAFVVSPGFARVFGKGWVSGGWLLWSGSALHEIGLRMDWEQSRRCSRHGVESMAWLCAGGAAVRAGVGGPEGVATRVLTHVPT